MNWLRRRRTAPECMPPPDPASTQQTRFAGWLGRLGRTDAQHAEYQARSREYQLKWRRVADSDPPDPRRFLPLAPRKYIEIDPEGSSCVHYPNHPKYGNHYKLQLSQGTKALPVIYWKEPEKSYSMLVRTETRGTANKVNLPEAIRYLRGKNKRLCAMKQTAYGIKHNGHEKEDAYAIFFLTRDGWGNAVRQLPDPTPQLLTGHRDILYRTPQEDEPEESTPPYFPDLSPPYRRTPPPDYAATMERRRA